MVFSEFIFLGKMILVKTLSFSLCPLSPLVMLSPLSHACCFPSVFLFCSLCHIQNSMDKKTLNLWIHRKLRTKETILCVASARMCMRVCGTSVQYTWGWCQIGKCEFLRVYLHSVTVINWNDFNSVSFGRAFLWVLILYYSTLKQIREQLFASHKGLWPYLFLSIKKILAVTWLKWRQQQQKLGRSLAFDSSDLGVTQEDTRGGIFPKSVGLFHISIW